MSARAIRGPAITFRRLATSMINAGEGAGGGDQDVDGARIGEAPDLAVTDEISFCDHSCGPEAQIGDGGRGDEGEIAHGPWRWGR